MAGSSAGQAVRAGVSHVSESAVGQAARSGGQRVVQGLQAIHNASERIGERIAASVTKSGAERASQATAASAAGDRLNEIVRFGGPFPSEAKAKAIGAAVVDVPGFTGPTELRAISGKATDALGEGAPVFHATTPTQRTLPAAKSISSPRGEFPFSHVNDAEIKLLEGIREHLPKNAVGTIDLTTLRSKAGGTILEPLPACSSCQQAMFAFLGDHPGIAIRSHAAVYSAPVSPLLLPMFSTPLGGAAAAAARRF
jgi:hypothetical protein